MSGDAWISACWLDFINLSTELRREVRRGKVLARKRLVENLEVRAGLVSADVREEHGGTVSVKIRQPLVTPEEWDVFLDAAVGNAGLAAELLAGRMSEAMSGLFVDAGLELFPYTLADVKNYCTCGRSGPACVHSVATHIALAQAMSAAPLLLLTFRGLEQTTLFEALRARRGSPSATQKTAASVEEESLFEGPSALRDAFWQKGPLPAMGFHFASTEAAEANSLPVVRALGLGPSNTAPDDVAHVLEPILAVARGRLAASAQVTLDLSTPEVEPEEPPLDEILVRAAQQHGSLTAEFVASALAIDLSQAAQYLNWLVEEERLARDEKGPRVCYVPGPRADT